MLPPKYDPLDPALVEDPYPIYARLREAAPLCRGGVGQWVVTRHAEATAALRDARLGHEFSDEYHRFSLGDGEAAAFFRRILLYRDPPQHTRLRRPMTHAFAAPARLAARVRELIAELLEPYRGGGELDLVTALALPLPIRVICELMSIPPEDWPRVQPLAAALAMGFGTRVPEGERAACDRAVAGLRDYLRERLARPRDDDSLLGRLASALDRDEVIDNAVFLFFAGFETTTNLIANGVAALLDHPDELARLRRDRSLVGSAVEELLRFDPPIQGVGRMVREPVDIGGYHLRPGRVLIVLLGAANRDPRQFADPGRLDIARSPNPHVSFGAGTHGCLGAALARLEVAAVLEQLVDRFAGIEPAAPPVRNGRGGLRGYAHLPLRVRP